LLRLLVAGHLLFRGTRGKRLARGVVLVPHLRQKEVGTISLEDKLAATWGVGGFPLVGEEYQWTLPFLVQDDAAAFRVHLHRVVVKKHISFNPRTLPSRPLVAHTRK